jgi:hypothetical protein
MGISLVSSEPALNVRSPQSSSVLLGGEDNRIPRKRQIEKALRLKTTFSRMLDLMQ